MRQAKLDTIEGRLRQAYNIRQSAMRLEAKRLGEVSREGDNFRFVQWGGLVDLKLWVRRKNT